MGHAVKGRGTVAAVGSSGVDCRGTVRYRQIATSKLRAQVDPHGARAQSEDARLVRTKWDRFHARDRGNAERWERSMSVVCVGCKVGMGRDGKESEVGVGC